MRVREQRKSPLRDVRDGSGGTASRRITNHGELFSISHSATKGRACVHFACYRAISTWLLCHNSVFRSYMKYKWDFGNKYLKEILFTLMELVKKEIARVIAGTNGIILHDGWTHYGTHYFGVHASFMRKYSFYAKGFHILSRSIRFRCFLLALWLMRPITVAIMQMKPQNLMRSLNCGILKMCSSTTILMCMTESAAPLPTTVALTNGWHAYWMFRMWDASPTKLKLEVNLVNFRFGAGPDDWIHTWYYTAMQAQVKRTVQCSEILLICLLCSITLLDCLANFTCWNAVSTCEIAIPAVQWNSRRTSTVCRCGRGNQCDRSQHRVET